MNKRLNNLKVFRSCIGVWFIAGCIALIMVIIISIISKPTINRGLIKFYSIYIANIIFASLSLILINKKIHNFYKNLFKEVS